MTGRVSSRIRFPHVVLTVAAVLIVLFALILRVRPGGEFVARAVDDLGQSFAAGLGALGCAWRALHTRKRWRLSWSLLAAACLAWCAGELVWSYYELIARRATPFPSPADIGYLLFPALALPGLLVRPSAALAGRGWVRVVLDGAMVAGSLFNLSWSTALGQVYRSGGPVFAYTVSLAYPVTDLVMLAVAVIVLAHAPSRSGLPLVASGLVLMALADSGFSYLTAVGRYHTGSIVDIAWFGAFVCLGVSGVLARAPMSERGSRAGEPEIYPGTHVESPVFLALPYVCVAVGGVAEGVGIARSNAAPITLAVESLAIVALLVRQLLTVLDNRNLVHDVVAQQAQLRFRAFHDALTGLANRALFHDRARHALDLHARDRRPLAVLFCDLDGFKTINDSLGHDAGDALLVATAERLDAMTRPGDTVARLGGDEFAILLEDGGDVDVLSQRVLTALAGPVELGDHAVPIRASIGTARVDSTDPAIDITELLKRADLAMYAAKRSGKGVVVPFTPELASGGSDDLDRMLTLAHDVHAGILRTAFQPIILVDGSPYGLEALARWRYRGVDIAPAQFIPLAERSGVLADLDLLMIRNALARMTRNPNDEQLLISVNLGVSVLGRADLPERIESLLTEYAVDHRRLVLEISESETLDDPRAFSCLQELRARGLALAVDDFGMGYSNLSRLIDLAPEVVKLDMSLVRPLERPDAPRRLVAGVIQLAHDLGAMVIGEGVETPTQLDALRELGCDAVQGFLIGRPSLSEGVRPIAAVSPIVA